MIIPIVFATDDNYVLPLSVAIKSLIDNKKYIYNLNKLNLKNSYTLFIDEVEKLINKGEI